MYATINSNSIDSKIAFQYTFPARVTIYRARTMFDNNSAFEENWTQQQQHLSTTSNEFNEISTHCKLLAASQTIKNTVSLAAVIIHFIDKNTHVIRCLPAAALGY